MLRQPGRLAPLAVLAVAAIVVGACSGTAATASPSAATPVPATPAATAAPTTAPSTAPTSAPSSAFSPQVYPATAVDCKNPPKGYTGEISQIKALDANTVEFDLCVGDVAFLDKIAFSTNGIMDSDWLNKHAPDKSYVRTTNGTGPYMLKEWVSGDHLTFVANPNYTGPNKPVSPTVIVKWSDTAAKRLQELQAGTADVMDNVAPDDDKTVKADSTLQLVPRPAFTILYLGFNVDDPPWNNEQVRQAIAIGIDRQRLVDTFEGAGSTVADHFAACTVPGGCEGPAWPATDTAKAKQMLQAANFDFSKTYDLSFRPKVRQYVANPPGVAQDLQAQFANLGIKINLHQEDNAQYLTNSDKGQYPLFLLGWTGDYFDMTDWADYHFGVGSGPRFGTHFKDITDVLSKAATTVDPTARLALYGQFNTLLAQHVPAIPLYHAGSALAARADTTGVVPSPIGMEAWWTIKPGDRNQVVFEQNAETSGLYCGDESDGDSLRNCYNVYDALYQFKPGGGDVVPDLATDCKANAAGDVWTCTLRQGVKFADGSTFDANDVVATYAAQWDAKNPNHVGNGGTFDYFPALFGGFLNPPSK